MVLTKLGTATNGEWKSGGLSQEQNEHNVVGV